MGLVAHRMEKHTRLRNAWPSLLKGQKRLVSTLCLKRKSVLHFGAVNTLWRHVLCHRRCFAFSVCFLLLILLNSIILSSQYMQRTRLVFKSNEAEGLQFVLPHEQETAQIQSKTSFRLKNLKTIVQNSSNPQKSRHVLSKLSPFMTDFIETTKKDINRTMPTPHVQPNGANERKTKSEVFKALCPKQPPNLIGMLDFRFNATPPTLKQIQQNNPKLKIGGSFQPENCESRHRVAFIIPHRGREMHLRALLWHNNPIWQRQQLYYKVYVVHQAGDLPFNKAKLMNVGFLQATQEDTYDCVVFHDVDMLPETDQLLYTCQNTPKHLSVAIDKYNYRLPYSSIFGGVTMVTPAQFYDVNGYSNKYWGWGGEDDDMYMRLFGMGYTINRPPLSMGRYKMSFHARDKGNRQNSLRFDMLSDSSVRMHEDGLNSLQYSITKVTESKLYTNITVDVGTALLRCKPTLSEFSCNVVSIFCEYLKLFCTNLEFLSTDDGTLVL